MAEKAAPEWVSKYRAFTYTSPPFWPGNGLEHEKRGMRVGATEPTDAALKPHLTGISG
jgi:hypothetical protein